MVVIRGVPGSGPARPARGARAGGGAFNLGGGMAPDAAAAAEGVAPTSAIGLLALQEGAPAAERDARARRRGEAMLQGLAMLQAALLGGRLDPARLAQLAGLADGAPAADPALQAAVAGIALRLRVELARLRIDPDLSSD
ncbi:flagellar assembly protein FliX [Roseomonas sp. HF4]|uniref:flagellar assembly protein FliX n=1 Tax=Roseomonas sp. HF4 TaxID=2562313 RepID=UPI0010BF8BAA|nr:flagellar assembly protein FliX [Roseomonas sp. HF4]